MGLKRFLMKLAKFCSNHFVRFPNSYKNIHIFCVTFIYTKTKQVIDFYARLIN